MRASVFERLRWRGAPARGPNYVLLRFPRRGTLKPGASTSVLESLGHRSLPSPSECLYLQELVGKRLDPAAHSHKRSLQVVTKRAEEDSD